MSPRRVSWPQRGFTLVEVLVALVIAGTAAGLISAALRGFLERVTKERLHQQLVSDLLNRAALVRFASAQDARWVYEGETLRLVPREEAMPELVVRNYQPRSNMPLPPIEMAFTPYQQFALEVDRYAINFLRPSLPSPVRRTAAEPPSSATTTETSPSAEGESTAADGKITTTPSNATAKDSE